MLQSRLPPGTSTPRRMQGDRTRSGMIDTLKIITSAARGLSPRGLRMAAAAARVRGLLTACTGEQFQKGYILPPGALEQIPIGASQDQVLIVMGTPSTVATLNGEV